MMTVYESIFILRATLSDQETSAVMEKMKNLLEQHGATILKADNWGKKKLAYKMKHDRRGTYLLLQFETDKGSVVSELERLYRLEDSVMKFLTVKVDPEPPAVAVAVGEGEGEGASEDGRV